MKTKTTKTKKFPDIGLPKTPDREPTDAELQALAAEPVEEPGDEPSIDELIAAPKLASASFDFARLGLNEIAYVRQAVVDEQPIWSIYSASGHPLGAAPTLEQAWGAIIQNELQPVHVH